MSTQALTLILPLFLIIAIGYAFRKFGFVREDSVGDLNRIVFYFALPATLFLETANLPDLTSGIALTAVSVPVVVITTALLSLVVSIRIPPARRGPFIQAAYRANLAYLGLPIVSTLLGPDSLGIIAVAIAAGVIVNTSVSIFVLRLFQPNAEPSSAVSRLMVIVKNPLIISILLGLLASVVSVPIPGLVVDTLSLFSRISLPLILLVVGFRLSFTNIRGSLGTAAAASFIKLIIMPMIVYAVATWVIPVEPFLRTALVLLFAMPTAVISQSFAGVFNADENLAASVVSMTIIFSVVTIPLWAVVMG